MFPRTSDEWMMIQRMCVRVKGCSAAVVVLYIYIETLKGENETNDGHDDKDDDDVERRRHDDRNLVVSSLVVIT